MCDYMVAAGPRHHWQYGQFQQLAPGTFLKYRFGDDYLLSDNHLGTFTFGKNEKYRLEIELFIFFSSHQMSCRPEFTEAKTVLNCCKLISARGNCIQGKRVKSSIVYILRLLKIDSSCIKKSWQRFTLSRDLLPHRK